VHISRKYGIVIIKITKRIKRDMMKTAIKNKTMKKLSNKEYKKILYSAEPQKQPPFLVLDVEIDLDYLFIYFDFRNGVFKRLELDIDGFNELTDEQLKITVNYFNNFLNNN
jgi:hypothetical protein